MLGDSEKITLPPIVPNIVPCSPNDEMEGLYYGFPGPPPYTPGSPIRVLIHNRVARQEGMECFTDYLVGALGNNVEVQFTVSTCDERTGKLLEKYGPVHHVGEDEKEDWWKFFRVVMDFRPHIVHSSHVIGAKWAARCGIPCVCTVHGIDGGKFFGSDYADIAVGVSEAASKDTDIVIRNGIRPLPWPETRRENTVVWFGRLDSDRNPIPFFEALRRLPNVNGLIVGRACRDTIDVSDRLAQYGIADRVEHVDVDDPQEARVIASTANVVVSCVNESFGLGIAELMTAGVVPVVIRGPGFQSKMVGQYGVVVRPTVGGLVEGITEALKRSHDETFIRRMATWATNEYNVNRTVPYYLDVYRSVLLPTVDVVIVAWNELEVTKCCVNAVLANTWAPYRLILVDNGSEEPVADYFRSLEQAYDHVHVIVSKENLGCPGGRQLAYEQFPDGEYVFWLDNDMMVTPGWLGRLARIVRNDPSIGALSPWNTIYAEGLFNRSLHELNFHGSNALYSRRAIEAVMEEPGHIFSSPFREVSGRADTDLLCRLKEAGFKLMFDGTVHLHHLGGMLHKGYNQGFTRRHLNLESMDEAEKAFLQKWSSFGVRRNATQQQ